MKIIHSGLAVLAGVLVMSACREQNTVASRKIDFVKDIKPILQDRCVSCHNNENFTGDLILQSRATAFGERKGGPIIIPGDSAKSLFWAVLNLQDRDPKAMPPVGHRVPAKEMETIQLWIDQGAEWPEGAAGAMEPVKANKSAS
jgi:uncharacterized membrane protein